jgi:predicted acyl esterase
MALRRFIGSCLGWKTDFFLEEANGTPESVYHSGRLIDHAPANEPPSVIVSDPHELPELEMAEYVKSENATSQFRSFQKRAINFHSEPFAKDTEIAGQMRLKLNVQADAPDFDFWAQVLMVSRDGSTVRLGEDIRRARFRNSFFKEELLNQTRSWKFPSSLIGPRGAFLQERNSALRLRRLIPPIIRRISILADVSDTKKSKMRE